MPVKGYVAGLMNWSDRRIRASTRFAPSLFRLVSVGVIVVCLFIAIPFISLAGGLGFAALVLHQTPLAYGAAAALALMVVLVAIALRFRHKTYETLNAFTDLASLSEFVLEGLFEGLREVVIGIGLAIVILGAAAALVSHLMRHEWITPVSLALVGAGSIELVLGGLAALAVKRLFEVRLKNTARLAIDWARANAPGA
jgi:hypothetical protein